MKSVAWFKSYLFLKQRISEIKQYFVLEFFKQVFESIPNNWDFYQFLNRWSLLRILGEKSIDDVFELI
jgi:hypothetical protein